MGLLCHFHVSCWSPWLQFCEITEMSGYRSCEAGWDQWSWLLMWLLTSALLEAAGKSGVPNYFLKPENVYLLVKLIVDLQSYDS